VFGVDGERAEAAGFARSGWMILVVRATTNGTSPVRPVRSLRVSIVVDWPVLVPKSGFEEIPLPRRSRSVEFGLHVVFGRTVRVATSRVNIRIRSTDIGAAAVSEEHVDA
jgi:hypothetical protein